MTTTTNHEHSLTETSSGLELIAQLRNR